MGQSENKANSKPKNWIPACAGMTVWQWIPPYAGMIVWRWIPVHSVSLRSVSLRVGSALERQSLSYAERGAGQMNKDGLVGKLGR